MLRLLRTEFFGVCFRKILFHTQKLSSVNLITLLLHIRIVTIGLTFASSEMPFSKSYLIISIFACQVKLIL